MLPMQFAGMPVLKHGNVVLMHRCQDMLPMLSADMPVLMHEYCYASTVDLLLGSFVRDPTVKIIAVL